MGPGRDIARGPLSVMAQRLVRIVTSRAAELRSHACGFAHSIVNACVLARNFAVGTSIRLSQIHTSCGDLNATVRVTVEISADLPYGTPESIPRAVCENATSFYLKNSEWE